MGYANTGEPSQGAAATRHSTIERLDASALTLYGLTIATNRRHAAVPVGNVGNHAGAAAAAVL